MIRLGAAAIGRSIEHRVTVTPDDIRRYGRSIGDPDLAAGPCDRAPLGYALTLRGGPRPEVVTDEGTVSVHGGHVLTAERPLAPGAYLVRTRIADVFEKSGRSGALTVITRRAEIFADDGQRRAIVDDQQIVRWRTATAAPPRPRPDTSRYAAGGAPLVEAESAEIGDLIAVEQRAAPAADAIARYAYELDGPEPLFVDPALAHALGYADVIVPGPMQSALLERLLRARLPGWHLRRLSVTFRLSVAALEPITLGAEVIEQRDGGGLTLDLWIENGHGERAALGTAELDR